MIKMVFESTLPWHQSPWSVLGAMVLICAVSLFCLLMRLEWKRWELSRRVPCFKARFLNILGDFSKISFSEAKKIGLPATLYQYGRAYHAVFKKEKLFCLWAFYEPYFVATKAEAFEEMIGGTKMMQKSWNYSFLHPWLRTGLLTSNGEKWKSRRRLLTPAFHFEILKDFLPIFNEKTAILVTKLRKEIKNPYTDVMRLVTLCSLDIICETTLGVNIGAQSNQENQYVKSIAVVTDLILRRMFNYTQWLDFPFWYMKDGRNLKKHIRILSNFTKSVIREKKEKLLSGKSAAFLKKRKALMDVLLEQHVENQTLTEEDIKEEVETFTFEGHDTTSMGITWTLYLLGIHSDIQEKVHEELDRIFGNDIERPCNNEDLKDMRYLECVIKESLRLYPPVPFFARKVDEENVICGELLPKGSVCIFMTFLLHRDEEVFKDPERFDPTRFDPDNSQHRHPYAYVPFSAGPRNCIGQRFAMMEMKTVVSTLLRNFSLESLDPVDTIIPLPELVLRPDKPIRIKIRPR